MNSYMVVLRDATDRINDQPCTGSLIRQWRMDRVNPGIVYEIIRPAHIDTDIEFVTIEELFEEGEPDGL